MKRDKVIDIFGSKWTLKQVKGEIKSESSNDDTIYFGLTNLRDRVIYLNSELNENEFNITLLHELFHAITATGLYNGSCDDEPLIEFLARSIYSLSKQGIITINYGRENTNRNK